MKGSEVCVRNKDTPASVTIQGQVTKHTTVKWAINNHFVSSDRIVSFTAVVRVVTQREERCVATLITAANETTDWMAQPISSLTVLIPGQLSGILHLFRSPSHDYYVQAPSSTQCIMFSNLFAGVLTTGILYNLRSCHKLVVPRFNTTTWNI